MLKFGILSNAGTETYQKLMLMKDFCWTTL